MSLAKQEFLLAVGFAKMLRTNVYTLNHDAGADALVDFNTDRMRVHIEDATDLTMVVAMGHALVYGTINVDGDVFVPLEDGLCNRRCAAAVLAEVTGENFPGLTSETLRMSHLEWAHYQMKSKGGGLDFIETLYLAYLVNDINYITLA